MNTCIDVEFRTGRMNMHPLNWSLQIKKVAPLGHRVFVKVGEHETKTEGGVFLPVSSQKRSTQGEIVDAGTAKALKVG